MTNSAQPDEPADVELLAAWIDRKRIQDHVAELVRGMVEEAHEQPRVTGPELRLVAGAAEVRTPRRGRLRLAPLHLEPEQVADAR